MKKPDNITRILKSIHPIRRPFSKISKELNQSFKYSSLGNLLNKLDKKQIYIDKFIPPPDKTPHKNDYDINFQNSIDYINELSDINNLPLVAKNKNYLINGEFNPDFEIENMRRENNKNYFIQLKELRKKQKIKKSKEILKKFKDSDSNLILGKYNPNFDSVKPRIPHALIRSPNVHIKDPWLNNYPFRNTFENFKLKNKKDNTNNNNIPPENNIKKFSRNIKKIKLKENISSFNNSKISKKTEDSINVPNIIYLSNKNINKIKIKKIKRFRKIIPEIKGQVSFDKMKKRKSLFKKSESNIAYFPSYEYTLPHTPSYIFKYIKNKENYKKYINGKIIRGYTFDSENYYVMKLRNKYKSK